MLGRKVAINEEQVLSFLGIRPASDVPGRLKTDPGRARRAPRGVSCSGTELEG
uniref:hypothetical protein n=1 Tax=Corallococcus coralloides TaxID=184914 RepID=UPI0013E8CC24|nr:hypothetical protein [Corallococcus coralloides]